MVLAHLPERETALERMVSALKPGGWLLCEDGDNVSATPVSPSDPASRELYTKIENAVARVMAGRGMAYDLGRRLYGLLRAEGLTEVQVEGRVALRYAGATAEVARLMVEQLREDIVNAEYVTEAEIEAYVALLHDPAFVAVGMTLFAVWGRRAEALPTDSREAEAQPPFRRAQPIKSVPTQITLRADDACTRGRGREEQEL